MTVSTDTITTALGRPPSGLEEDQWNLWIDDALMLIEARLGDPALLDQAKLDYVVREAVVAHIRHPDDATQVGISVDDGQSTRTYRTAKGRVSIIDDWWNLLSPVASSGAFGIDTVGCGNAHLPWCSLYFGGAACSCGVDIAGFPIFEGAGYIDPDPYPGLYYP